MGNTQTQSCQLMFYDSPNDPNVKCFNHCPTSCSADEMACPSDYIDPSGCPSPDVCMGPLYGYHGQQCPRTMCDTSCPTDDQQACDAGYDANGCPNPMVCQPMKVPGNMDPVTKPMSVMGNMDPITMTSFECVLSCDPTCSKDHQLCDMGFDTNGCPRPKECRYTKNTYWDSVTQTQMDCAFSCPTPCGTGDMYCPSTDENGCTGAGTCVMESWESPKGNGNWCTGQCPMNCGPGMMECAGAMDENDCPMPSTCVAEGAICP